MRSYYQLCYVWHTSLTISNYKKLSRSEWISVCMHYSNRDYAPKVTSVYHVSLPESPALRYTARKIFIHVLTKFIDKLKHLNEYYILYCLRYWCCIYTDTIHYPQIKRNIRYLIIRRSNIDCLIKIYTVVLPASHMNGYGRITIFNVNFSVFQQWPTHGRNQHSKCQASDPEYI